MTLATGIGFIPLPAAAAESTRQTARATLSEQAGREGIALVHVYEPLGTDPDQMRATMSALSDLASRCGARTLISFGALTAEILALARSAEMRLIAVPDPAHRRPSRKRQGPGAAKGRGTCPPWPRR